MSFEMEIKHEKFNHSVKSTLIIRSQWPILLKLSTVMVRFRLFDSLLQK